ncbi:hypothetical protein P9112_007599 [Eukaryota sp. TZLM1-RC]
MISFVIWMILLIACLVLIATAEDIHLSVNESAEKFILWSKSDAWIPLSPSQASNVYIQGRSKDLVVVLDKDVSIMSLHLRNVILQLNTSSLTVKGLTCLSRAEIHSLNYDLSSISTQFLQFVGKENIVNSTLIIGSRTGVTEHNQHIPDCGAQIVELHSSITKQRSSSVKTAKNLLLSMDILILLVVPFTFIVLVVVNLSQFIKIRQLKRQISKIQEDFVKLCPKCITPMVYHWHLQIK